ncbi:NADP-dependent oxidoreductase [Dactylosporangium sp. NPDC048998]|uniref:NADP-dependent oxidoreductase n=1 Tax=Dactylosporangium sp. NPDC048998 TaxID=3363976 RepID=UPI00372086EB
MFVVEVSEFGDADRLRGARRPDPAPVAGRVPVRVSAAVVNPVDVWTRAGALAALLPDLRPPFVLGWDFAGVTDDGTAVAGLVPWFADAGATGTYAERLLADPAWLAPIPAGVDPAEAATLALNGLTARQALPLAGLPAGARLLVTGASGGVGGFAVQLAVAAGLDVTAIASPGDEAFVAGLGAKEVVTRGAALPVGAFDAALDAASHGGVLHAVRDGGAYVAVTGPSAPAPERGIRVAEVHVVPSAEGLAALLADLAAGRLTTRIAGRLPLAEAAEAHRRVERGGLRGKLVLLP